MNGFHNIVSMDQNHLHTLIKKMSTAVKCPKCLKRIFPQDIQLKSSSLQDCSFVVHCSGCNTESCVSAHVETQLTSQGKRMNASSLISDPILTEEDVQIAQKKIKTNASISELFPIESTDI